MSRVGALVIAMLVASFGATRSPAREAPSVKTSQPSSDGVANLPFSRGRRFAHLDDYLAYLRTLGAQDIPFYQPVRPGVYELITLRAPGEPPRFFTRQELLDRFGFKD